MVHYSQEMLLKNAIKNLLKMSYLSLREWATVELGEPPRMVFFSRAVSVFFYVTLARISASQGGWTGAVWAIESSLHFKQSASQYVRKAKYLLELKQPSEVLDTLEVALERNPANYTVNYMLATLLVQQKRWVDAISSLESLNGVYASNPDILFLLATAYRSTNRFSEAVLTYDELLKIQKLQSRTKHRAYYGKSIALRRSGKAAESSQALQDAMAYATDKQVKRLGAGYLHEKMRNYKDAIYEYEKQLESNESDHEVYMHLGNIHRDMFKLAEASRYYKEALARKKVPLYSFELGVSQEMAGDMTAATKSYRMAADLSPKNLLFQYRLGLATHSTGDTSLAEEIFRKNKIFVEFDEGAARNKGLPPVKQRYAEYHNVFKVEEKTILYESMLGMAFSCNPYAIFKTLLDDKRFKDYHHIWVIDDLKKIPSEIANRNNVTFVQKHSELYMKYLVSAKYLINNSTFPTYFTRKAEQKYLNTWHGTPWKTLGADIKGEIFGHANTARNFLQASHILSPNKHTTSVMLDSNDVASVMTAGVAEIGYPRVDATLNSSEEVKSRITNILGLDRSKKTVLYAPTWRGTMGDKRINTKKIQKDIEDLQSLGANVLFRGHHYTENQLPSSISVVPSNIDTNELLAVVDILVSDYSSIVFDFMATGRPIIYYLYDLEEYTNNRGLYFKPGEMPGVVTDTIRETVVAVSDILSEDSTLGDKNSTAKQRFCPHDDGKATQRAVEWLFFNKLDKKYLLERDEAKLTVLMYAGGFKSNGITTSFLNLLSHVDSSELTVATVIAAKDLQLDPERLKKYNEQPNGIARLGTSGSMVATAAQRKAIDFFVTNHHHANDASKALYESAYKQEFSRCFGSRCFDAVVEYSGYNTYWASLFAQAKSERKVIYTHSDLESERKARFSNLEDVFRQYPYYTKVISVSVANRDLNRGNIAEKYRINKDLFDYCDNIQDSERVLGMAKGEPSKDVIELLSRGGVKFVNLARLSPEKDHKKLFEAFKVVVEKDSSAKLFICGDGPLRGSLEAAIKEMNLNRNVYLLGFQDNPYAIMKYADCFVLSSNYEGQPVVLYEAMAMGLSVIATNIEANENVLSGGYGRLVENTVDGLAEGMLAFVDGDTTCKPFDIKAHEQVSFDVFMKKVLGIGV